MANPALEELDRISRQRQQRSNNPYQNALNYVKQHGGDVKTAFYNLCQERGVNPNEILNLITGGNRYG